MFTEKHILVNPYNSHQLSRTVTGYEVTTVDCSADKSSGWNGATVNLTPYEAPAGYVFDGWNITGATITGSAFNFVGSDVTVSTKYADNLNPLGLPDKVIRLKYDAGYEPTSYYSTKTLVDAGQNIWDVKFNSTDWTDYLRYNATGLNAILGANTTTVTSLSRLAYGCSGLTSVALFDTSNVKDLNMCFADCSALKEVPAFNTKNVSAFGGAFQKCKNLSSVGTIDLTNATEISYMFNGCSSLKSVNMINSTTAISSFNVMFQQCYALTSLPILNGSNVTSITNYCTNCSSLTSIPNYNFTKVSASRNAFYGCVKVTTGASALYNQIKNTITKSANYIGTFRNCGTATTQGAAELATIPAAWK